MDKDNQRKDTKKEIKDLTGDTDRSYDWEQYSNKLGNKIKEFNNDDEFLEEVNLSLAKQISMELEDKDTNTKEENQTKKKFPKGLKIFAITFSTIMLLFALLIFTPGGRKLIFSIAGEYIYGKLDYEDSKPIDDTKVVDDDVKVPVKQEDHVINILLLGVEEIGGASNTDLIMIASMNTKDKSIKLTSLMRDLYVQIPGYNDNKLNSAFAKGGIDLLYDTIETNFDIKMDGHILVNFNAFEKIVDLLGGVEITLTNNEAYYLNTTNYVSNPAYRNLVKGTQTVNGNQALGYCRVRYISTGTENNDFGRTQRQRAVMNSIFEKMKSKNILQLGLFMNDVFSNVNIKTDITQSEFNTYLEEGVSLNISQMEDHRIPSDGNYDSKKVLIGKYNQDVLIPTDWEATRTEIHEFIYGETATDSVATDSVTADSVTTDSLTIGQ